MKAQKHNKMIRNNKDLSDLYIIKKCICGSKDIDINDEIEFKNDLTVKNTDIVCFTCFRSAKSVNKKNAIIKWNSKI
jgi:hypothetical protein